MFLVGAHRREGGKERLTWLEAEKELPSPGL